MEAGQIRRDIDAGVLPPGASTGAVATLGDRVWVDTNGNGVKNSEASEPGVAGVTVELLANDGVTVLDTVSTDSDGVFKFLVAPGEYHLRVVLPSGWVFTPPDVGTDESRDSDFDPVTGMTALITITDGVIAKTWDAGLIPA